MYTHLGSVTLKTGEQMELGVVLCPDQSWAAQIIPLLGHKSRETREHFERAFAGPLDGLETRFYVGTVGGFAITNVMIVGARGVGILGHVYTRPEHRQKGAYAQLMAAQMADIQAAGYRALTLGTGFESHPYWIYHRFGFRSIDGQSGRMKWLATPDFEVRHYQPGATTVRPLRWDDWAHVELLSYQPCRPEEDLPRSWTFRTKTQGGAAEAMFQSLQRSLARRAPISGLVLESEHGALAGWAIVQADDLSFGDGRLLDLYVHPAFPEGAAQLLDAVPWPEGRRVAAYTTGHGSRAAALRRAGFQPVAELASWLRDDAGAPMSLHVLARG